MFLTTNGAPPTAALGFEIDIHMTDAFEAQGEFAPVQSTNNNEFIAAMDTMSEAPILEALDAAAPEIAAVEEPSLPNGFIRLGLAPELIAAVADLGFTQ